MRNIFLEKSLTKCGEEATSTDHLLSSYMDKGFFWLPDFFDRKTSKNQRNEHNFSKIVMPLLTL